MRLTPLLSTLALCGCSFILDPEVCSDDADCNGAQATCQDGICIGPEDPDPEEGVDANPSEAGTDALPGDDTGGQDDMSVADVKRDEDDTGGETPDLGPDAPPSGTAPTCEIAKPDPSPPPVNEAEVDVIVVVADDEPEDAIRATFAGAEISIDPETNTYEGTVAVVEGTNTFRLEATDADDLSCSAQVVVVGDFTAPAVELFDSIDAPIVHNERVKRIEGRVAEAHYARRLLEVEVGGEAIDAELAWSGDEFLFPLELDAGRNEVAIVAIDDAGNASEPVEFVIIFDDEAPVVRITAPERGAMIESDRVDVRGSATKGGEAVRPSNVVITARQGRRQPITRNTRTGAGGGFDAPINLHVGENEIEVCVTDARSGNEGCATVDVAREDPDACVSFDENLELVTEDDVVLLEGDACPVVDVVTVRVGDADAVEAELANGRWSLEVMLPNPGTYPVTAEARGGGDTAQAMAEIIWDDSAPGVSITRPDESTCHNGETVQVCGRAQDPESGVVRVLINGVDAEVDVSGNFCHDAPVDEGAGEVILARAVNGAGAFRDASVEIDVDRVAPEVELDTPPAAWLGVDRNGRVHLQGTIESGVCGVTTMTVDGEQAGIDRDRFTKRLVLGEGDHVVAIVTRDRAGNERVTNYAFRVDATDPVVDALIPAATVIISVAQIEVGARACDNESGIRVAQIAGEDVEPEVDEDDENCVVFRRVLDVDEGLTRVAIHVEDAVGREADSEIIVSRDVTGPVVVVTHPPEGATVASTTIVRGTVDDGEFGSGVDTVTVNGIEADFEEDGTWVVSGVRLEAGAQALTVVGTDNADNETDPVVVRNVRVVGYHAEPPALDGFTGVANVAWLGAADVDNDGRLDILAVSGDPDSASALYAQRADGTFAPVEEAGLPSMAALRHGALGDFDGDRLADVLIVGNNRNGVFRGDGAGGVASVAASGVPNGMDATQVAVGDLDRDGALDALAFAGNGTRLLIGNGDATFQREPHADVGLGGTSAVVAGTFVDVNDDGVLDLVGATGAGSALWIGDRAGAFAQAANDAFPSVEATFVLPIDANRDGHLDVLTAGAAARFHLGDSEGNFAVDALGLEWAEGEDIGAVAADLDGDARDDLIVYGAGGPKFWSNTPGGFVRLDLVAAGVPADIGPVTTALAVDIDVDGDTDVVLGGPGGVSLIRSNRTAVDEGYRFVHLDILRATLDDDVLVGPHDAIGALLTQDLDGDLRADRILVPAPVGPTVVTLAGRDLADATAKFVDKGAEGNRFRDVVELAAGERAPVVARE